MKKKVIKLSENDLQRIVKRVIREEKLNELGGMEDTHPRFGDIRFSDLSRDEILNLGRGEFDYEEEGSDSVSDEEIDDYYYKEPPMSKQEFEEERRRRLSRSRGQHPRQSGRKPFGR